MSTLKCFFKNILSMRWIIITYVIIYIVISIIVASSMTTSDKPQYAPRVLKLGYVDRDDTAMSRNLLDFLGQHTDLRPFADDLDKQKEAVYLWEVSSVVTIPEGWQDSVLRHEPLEIDLLHDPRYDDTGTIPTILERYSFYVGALAEDRLREADTAAGGSGKLDTATVQALLEPDGEFFTSLRAALDVDTEVKMLSTDVGGVSGNQAWFDAFFPPLAYVLMAAILSSLTLVIHDFQTPRVLRRRRMSCHRPYYEQAWLLLGQLIVGIGIAVLIIGANILIRVNSLAQVNISRHLLATLLLILSMVALSNLIVQTGATRNMLSGISTILSLGLGFISGVFVPAKFLPEGVLSFAKIFPTYHYVATVGGQSQNIGDYLGHFLIMLLMTAVYTAATVVLARLQLSERAPKSDLVTQS